MRAGAPEGRPLRKKGTGVRRSGKRESNSVGAFGLWVYGVVYGFLGSEDGGGGLGSPNSPLHAELAEIWKGRGEVEPWFALA